MGNRRIGLREFRKNSTDDDVFAAGSLDALGIYACAAVRPIWHQSCD
jgi:hypothetical protein